MALGAQQMRMNKASSAARLRGGARPHVKLAATAVETPAVTTTDRLKEGYKQAVMLQAFGWDSCEKGGWYNFVKTKIPELKAIGFTHAWLPPPSQSVAPQGYMPGQLYNLNSSYGNGEELMSLIKELKAANISPIADIVINHRCADEQVDGVWNKFRDDVDHEGRKVDWGQWAITSTDTTFKGTGNPDTGDDYEPAPDLDHANPQLRKALRDWLRHLHNDIGFESWRFDYTKGYAPEFIKEYINGSCPEGEQGLHVGEFWPDLKWNGPDLDRNQDEARNKLVKWVEGCDKTSTSFDFVTKGILQEAIKNTQYDRLKDEQGRAPGFIGQMPGYATTFLDNHDTGSTQGHWPFPADGIATGHAYLLTHPGVPSVFWDHVITWGDELKNTIAKLIDIRKRNGIKADSELKIVAAEPDLYFATIDDKLAVKLGPRADLGSLKPGSEWKVAAEGKDFTVWEKSS